MIKPIVCYSRVKSHEIFTGSVVPMIIIRLDGNSGFFTVDEGDEGKFPLNSFVKIEYSFEGSKRPRNLV